MIFAISTGSMAAKIHAKTPAYSSLQICQRFYRIVFVLLGAYNSELVDIKQARHKIQNKFAFDSIMVYICIIK